MLSRSVYRWLIVLIFLLASCDDIGEDGLKALAKKIPELQPLSVIDPHLIDQINGLNRNTEEFNRVLAEAQRGGIPILFTADAGPELKQAADDFNRAVADMNNLKVGLDQETLTQLSGLAAILNAGLKVGLDKESIYELRYLTDTIAKMPENFEKSLVEAAPQVSKVIGDTLISVLDEARMDMEKLTAVIGVEGRCNADYLESKADAFVGRSVMGRVMARFGNNTASDSTLVISGVCQVLPPQIDLVWVNDQLNAADNSKNVQLYGYGLADATVQIYDDSGRPVPGMPEITPYETTRYLVQINIQGINFSQVGYRYRFVVQLPGIKSDIPIFQPPVPTWTPTPAPTATLLPPATVTCLKDNTPIHSYAARGTWIFARCNEGDQLRAISITLPDRIYFRVDVMGTPGYVHIDDVQLNVQPDALGEGWPEPTPTSRPPVPTPSPSCTFESSTTDLKQGESVQLRWTAENVKKVFLLYGDRRDAVDMNGEVQVTPAQTTTYKLALKLLNGENVICKSITINVKERSLHAWGRLHGGSGGGTFVDKPPGSAQVIGLYISYGGLVDSLKIVYDTADLPKHGGMGPNETTIIFEPGEYITAIYGSSGAYLDSLTIETSLGRRFGPFGGPGGSAFEERAPAGYEIVGFLGRAGVYIDAIGIVIRER